MYITLTRFIGWLGRKRRFEDLQSRKCVGSSTSPSSDNNQLKAMTDIRNMLNRAENREEDIRVELWELDTFGMDPTGMDLMLVVRLKKHTLSFVFLKNN